MAKVYENPRKKLEVKYSADVIVCGGGTAGVHAAVAAADAGKSVIIIEQFGSLSGSSGNALVTPYMWVHVPGEPRCSYTALKLEKILVELGGMEEHYRKPFDPMAMRFASEEMCIAAGVKILLYHYISDVITENGKVLGIVAVSKSGTYVVEGKEFIDCTGDGDACVLAGAAYTKGNPETGKCQPISLRYVVSGVDQDEFGKFLLAEGERTGVHSAASYNNGNIYASVVTNGVFTLTDLFDKAIAAGDLTPQDKAYWQVFYIPGRHDSLAFNNPEFFEDIDGTNAEHLTRTQLEGKQIIRRQLAFYKKYFRGFDNAYISEIAPMVGVRESRNIECEHILTGEEILSHKKFDDYIAQSNYPVDVHGVTLSCKKIEIANDDGMPWYNVPFSSLVVKGFENLFVAGRCQGCDFVAEASVRIQPTLRSSGEAAGIGAALAIDRNVKASEINGREVREIMISKGAIFTEQK